MNAIADVFPPRSTGGGVATPRAGEFSYVPYISQGTTVWKWVPTVADAAAPTALELGAGTDISCRITANDGWSTTQNYADVPSACSTFVPKIPATVSPGEPSLTIGLSRGGGDDPILELLTPGAAGYLAIYPAGDSVTQKMDLYHVSVGTVTKQLPMGDEAAKAVISFGIIDPPNLDLPVPAA